MGNYKAEIGKRVSYLRNLNGLTQENLAELLDCSVKHVSHAERGAALFSLEKYLFLSDYFHCSLDYLLKGINSDDVSSALPAESMCFLLRKILNPIRDPPTKKIMMIIAPK